MTPNAGDDAGLLFTLEELVDALDRRRPRIERVEKAEIAADADRLQACALQRIALLHSAEVMS